MDHEEFRNRCYDAYVSSLYGNYAWNEASLARYEHARVFYKKNYDRYLGRLAPGDRVLDVASGSGHFLYYLWKSGYRAEGVDRSRQQLDACRGPLPSDVELHHGDALAFLGGRPATYHAVVLNDFVEHLTRPEALEIMDRVHRALRPGGFVLFRVPNAFCPYGFGALRSDITHETGYTEESSVQLLSVAGFRNIEVSPVDAPVRTPLHVAPWLVRRAMWRLHKLRCFVHDFKWPSPVVSRELLAFGVRE